jgi:hypothetical protein
MIASLRIHHLSVMPAKAGIQFWIRRFASFRVIV